MSTESCVNPQDLQSILTGRLPVESITTILSQLSSLSDVHPATGTVESFVVYDVWTLQVTGGKTFKGQAGGLSGLGKSSFAGVLTTSDLTTLYAKTESFMFAELSNGVSLTFFDSAHKPLGTFLGVIPSVTGIGGGTGSWS